MKGITMKVNVNITIEIDPADWYEVFGKGETAREVAQEVRDAIVEYVYQSNAAEGIPVIVRRNN